MTWDIFLDGRTGEWVFSAHRDLMDIGGEGHIEQRIMTRLRIVRGSFQYDTDGDLGSRLNLVSSYLPDRAAREIPSFVREALAPMSEIEVHDVIVFQDAERPGELSVQIAYIPVTNEGTEPRIITIPVAVTNL